MQDLTFVYKVPGFEGDDRLYVIRRGRIKKELPKPTGRRAREAVDSVIASVYEEPDTGPAALEPQDAAEILLVARWFRMRPEERRRTVSPARWLGAARRQRSTSTTS